MDSSITSIPKAAAVQTAIQRSAARRRRDNVSGYMFIAPWLIGFWVFYEDKG